MSNSGGSTPSPDPTHLGLAHVSLGAALTAITIATVGLVVEANTAVHLLRGAYAVLMGVFVVGVGGWLIRHVECRITHRIEELAGQRYGDGYADGFVDGAATTEARARVSDLQGRRLRPRLTSDS